MENAKVLLEEAGARMEDICKITTYVTEREYRYDVYPVIAKHLKDVCPVSTGLVVKGSGGDLYRLRDRHICRHPGGSDAGGVSLSARHLPGDSVWLDSAERSISFQL